MLDLDAVNALLKPLFPGLMGVRLLRSIFNFFLARTRLSIGDVFVYGTSKQ